MSDTAKSQAEAQARSICDMVEALDVDFDRLEELRELRKTPRYIAGWNMPGYMPDNESASFDNADDAREYIAESIERAADEIGGDTDETRSTADEMGQIAKKILLSEESTFSANCPDGFVYWITQDGNMLEPEDADELEELESAAGECASTEDAERQIDEDALCVEYRSGWTNPHEDLTPSEFRIILCTGGPHVEIVGDVDEHGEPSSPRILYRGWSEFGELLDFDHGAVLRYCSRFVFSC